MNYNKKINSFIMLGKKNKTPTVKTTVHSLFFIFSATPHFYAHVALYGLVWAVSET